MLEDKPSFVFAIGSEATGIIKYRHLTIMLNQTKAVVATFSFHLLQFEDEPINPEGQISLIDKGGNCTGSFFLGVDNSDLSGLKHFSDMYGLTNSAK